MAKKNVGSYATVYAKAAKTYAAKAYAAKAKTKKKKKKKKIKSLKARAARYLRRVSGYGDYGT